MQKYISDNTSLSNPEDQVNILMQQVTDDYTFNISVGIPQDVGHAFPTKAEKFEEDDLR